MHMFTREADVATPRAEVSRFGSLRSNKSKTKQPVVSDESSSAAESSEDEEVPPSRRRSRGLSFSSRKSDSGSKPASRPPSRPQSRTGRKRTDSTVGTSDKEKEKEKDKDKDKTEKSSRKLSVAGWASSAVNAVGSVASRGKKDKDKDNFATLRDDASANESDASDGASSAVSHSSRKGKHRKGKNSTSVLGTSPAERRPSIRKPQGKKVVVALHDFEAGSTDELSFHAGDQINVVNEVLDGWWMGELAGKRGLFPTTYTETLSPTPSAPPLPRRPPLMTRDTGASAPPVLSGAGERERKPFTARRAYEMSSSDEEHPFGDHNIASSRSPLFGQFNPDQGSGDAEEDEKERLIARSSFSDGEHGPTTPSINIRPPLSRRTTDTASSSSPVTKKPPPPPPPRRPAGSVHGSPVPPPIPSRPLHTKSSQSSSSSLLAVAATPLGKGGDGLTHSPFDSPGDAW